jgi:hypothetical protein
MSEAEEFDSLPVLARDARIVTERDKQAAAPDVRRSLAGSLPSVQAAAAAAGGLVAGAAVLGIVQRRHRSAGALVKASRKRSLGRRAGRGALPAAAESLQVVSSSTFLVEVHLLGTRNSDD